MKLQIKQINPNPYRDMENYPINREKVEALKASIEQTGFWDNILARPKKGKKFKLPIDGIGDLIIHGEPIVELAYGHHRLTALKEILSPDDIIDIPVKDLDDSTMIKIMANENMDEWKASPKVIDETVRVTKQYLEEHPEEAKKYGQPNRKAGSVEPIIGKIIISKFLNWNETRVHYSLQRLGMIEKEEIEKEAIYDLPTDTSARTFSRVVKKHNIPKQEQKQFAEKIKESESYGESAMDDVWIQDKYTKPQKKQYRDERVLTLETKIAQARNFLDEASDQITDMIRLIKELGPEPFNESVQGGLFLLTLDRIEKQIIQLRSLKLNEDENKSIVGNEDFEHSGE